MWKTSSWAAEFIDFKEIYCQIVVRVKRFFDVNSSRAVTEVESRTDVVRRENMPAVPHAGTPSNKLSSLPRRIALDAARAFNAKKANGIKNPCNRRPLRDLHNVKC